MRRGFMFSLIGVLLASLFILLFWFSNTPRLDSGAEAVNTRITVMNRYVESWDDFVHDATIVATRHTLLQFTEFYEGSSDIISLDDLTEDIGRYIYNGTSEQGVPELAGTDLHFLLGEFLIQAEQHLNVLTTFNVSSNVTIEDYAPFQLRVNLSVNYTIIDPLFARWNRTQRYEVIVPVEGLPDPLFTRYGSVALTTEENRTIVENVIPRELLNISTVEEMLLNRTYVANRGVAPSYLERLAGDLSLTDATGEAGFETLIIPIEVDYAALSIDAQNTSFTAYQVFDELQFECGNETLGINAPFTVPNFRLDIAHLARYNFNDTAQLDFGNC